MFKSILLTTILLSTNVNAKEITPKKLSIPMQIECASWLRLLGNVNDKRIEYHLLQDKGKVTEDLAIYYQGVGEGFAKGIAFKTGESVVVVASDLYEKYCVQEDI